MKTALIINFEGKNLIGKFSENNGKLKLEETIIEFEHNQPISNIEIMQAFKMHDCQRHDYNQFISGVGSNYQIVFLNETQLDKAFEMITGKVENYISEKEVEANNKKEVENNRIENAFLTAKETNTPQEISRYSYETSGDYIQVINEITYAMPDGSKQLMTEKTN